LRNHTIGDVYKVSDTRKHLIVVDDLNKKAHMHQFVRQVSEQSLRVHLDGSWGPATEIKLSSTVVLAAITQDTSIDIPLQGRVLRHFIMLYMNLDLVIIKSIFESLIKDILMERPLVDPIAITKTILSVQGQLMNTLSNASR
jgi:hypothetical protein